MNVIRNIQISKLHALNSIYDEKQKKIKTLNLLKNLTAWNKNLV